MARTNIDSILRAAAATPWAIVPEKLEAIVEFLALRAAGVEFTREEIQARVGEGRRVAPPQPQGGAIAVLPLYGTVAHRAHMVDNISGPGGTSTEKFGAAFDKALKDPEVGAIVLDVDSPGGAVAGVEELAKQIHAARGRKPIVAVANSLMASAAYWIASAADEVVATPSGDVGSIGVFMVHTNAAAALEKEGLAPTIVSAGRFKVEANPFGPLTDEARAALQAHVDDTYERFVVAVALHRGVTPAAVKAGYGQGRTLHARAALDAGLVDRVATLDDVVAELGGPKGSAGARKNAASARPMAPALIAPPGAPAEPPTFDAVAAAPAIVAAPPAVVPLPSHPAPTGKENTVSAEHTAPAGAAPADSSAILAAERKRSADIRALARDNGVAAERADALVDSGVTVEQAALEIMREQRAARAAGQPAPQVVVGADRAAHAPWRSLGEQLMCVMAASAPNGARDPRLVGGLQASAQGMNQGVPSEGGYLVAPQFSSMIWDGMASSPESLLSMTDNYTVEGESLTFQANAETSRATGSRFGGVRGYWINEADQITKSTPKLRQVKVEPQQLAVLVYVTEKLLRNSPVALQQYVSRAASEEINFLVGDAIVNGTGAGQPKGLLSSGSLITVNKETSQAAGTVLQENVSKMWARLHPRARKNAIWLHNVDVEPALDTLSTVVKNVAGTENVGGYANKVFDSERRTLKGRPLVASEFCATLGTVGDLILADLSGYLSGTRGGVESAMSMHVRFEYAEQAFRFMFEADGQPWLASALTPFKGSATQSTHIALQAR